MIHHSTGLQKTSGGAKPLCGFFACAAVLRRLNVVFRLDAADLQAFRYGLLYINETGKILP
jgi:hypothetical protein